MVDIVPYISVQFPLRIKKLLSVFFSLVSVNNGLSTKIVALALMSLDHTQVSFLY